MATPEWLNDDYVASLLASEATDPSSTRKKPADKPKPNTRFLKNVIKSTDSHNKALLAKEAAESKARLGVLEQTVETQRLKTNPNAKDIRKRQMAGIHAILGGGGPTKKRTRDEETMSPSSRTEHRDERSSREKSVKTHDLVRERGRRSREHGRLRESDSDRENDRERRRGKRTSRRHEENSEDRHRHSRRRVKERSRSRSPEDRRSRHRKDKDRSRSRSRSRSPRRRRSRSRSTSRGASSRQNRSHHNPSSSRHDSSKRQNQPRSPSPDSDPLESLLGPAPAPKYRGRGTIASSSGIDRRFSASYDPTTDITMEDETLDPSSSSHPPNAIGAPSNWDDAVEAFRDRQKMRQAQEDRLREAGFKEEEIKKMSGEVVDAQDVSFQWSKAGEKREWDLGKDGDGEDGDGLLNRAKWAGGRASMGLFSADDEY